MTSEMRTVHDPFEGKDVQISNRLTDRLRGQYAIGPHLPNGNPEFGWRQFQAPPIQHEAAARIEELEAKLAELSAPPGSVVPTEAVAYMVHGAMIPHEPVKAGGRHAEPDTAFYPASRKDDAMGAARILRAECTPLYALPLSPPRDEVVEALRKLVRSAYSEGFSEGMREHTSSRGGKIWQESSTAAALASMEGKS